MLKVESVSTSYGTRMVLKNISFMLDRGQILGVIGPNGTGKSTLIRALGGTIPLRSGRVLLDGQDLSHMKDRERALHMAFVPQAVQMPPAFTAWETVLLGRTPHLNWLGQASEEDEAIASQAMRRTNTLDLAQRRVGELSGGEQQRLLLARALAQATPILIMDEPTSHLDLQYQLSLLDMVQSLAREDGISVLAALHDLNLVARYADQVALLIDGQLEAFGKPREVLTPTLLSRAYHVPLQVLPIGAHGIPVITPAIL
jgi:ABC-type cobalamin/Fe3+-siderophores transport system ATPase subunit